MSVKKATSKAVFDACEQLELLDRPWNRDDVRSLVGGGSFSVIDPLVQAWRRLQPVREVAPTLPAELLVQVATMLEQQVSDFISEVDGRDKERAEGFDEAYEELSDNLQQLESDLSGRLELAQQANHSLEAEYSRLESELDNKNKDGLALELKLQLSEESNRLLSQRLQGQKEFYEQALERQKLAQQDNEDRIAEQNSQQVNQLKLEGLQQLSRQKSELAEASELAENRLMRMLDQERAELKQLQLTSDSKLESLRREVRNEKKEVGVQKLAINALESSLQQSQQAGKEVSLQCEAQLAQLKSEKNVLIGQAAVQAKEKSDLQELKDAITLLRGQLPSH
jgi:hypothetical protein